MFRFSLIVVFLSIFSSISEGGVVHDIPLEDEVKNKFLFFIEHESGVRIPGVTVDQRPPFSSAHGGSTSNRDDTITHDELLLLKIELIRIQTRQVFTLIGILAVWFVAVLIIAYAIIVVTRKTSKDENLESKNNIKKDILEAFGIIFYTPIFFTLASTLFLMVMAHTVEAKFPDFSIWF